MLWYEGKGDFDLLSRSGSNHSWLELGTGSVAYLATGSVFLFPIIRAGPGERPGPRGTVSNGRAFAVGHPSYLHWIHCNVIYDLSIDIMKQAYPFVRQTGCSKHTSLCHKWNLGTSPLATFSIRTCGAQDFLRCRPDGRLLTLNSCHRQAVNKQAGMCHIPNGLHTTIHRNSMLKSTLKSLSRTSK